MKSNLKGYFVKRDQEEINATNENNNEEEWPIQVKVRPKKGSLVKYLMKGDNEAKEGKVKKDL